MKYILSRRLIIPVFCLLLASPGWGQRKPRIRGNRSPVEVTESLPAFSRVVLNDDLEIKLEQGDSEGYRLEVDDNLVDILRFEVQDGTLSISSFYTVTGSKKLDITVYFRTLAEVIAQAGRISGPAQINTDVLQMQAGGSARLTLRARCSLCRLDLAGNSGADLNIEADSLAIQMTDRTDAVVYAAGQALSAELTGGASLTLEGLSDAAGVRVLEESSLRAERMEAVRLEASVDGAATARLRAGSEFYMDAGGQARLYLYGAPAVFVRRMAGRAELHKEED